MDPSIRRTAFRLVIRKIEPPFSNDLETELEWICQTFGFFEPIDREKTAAAVFSQIVAATERGEALTSTAIAAAVVLLGVAYLTQMTVVIEIASVILFGLLGGLVAPWFMNAPILLRYVEKKGNLKH